MAKAPFHPEGMPPIRHGHQPRGFSGIVAELILAWGSFDSSLLELITVAFRLKHDEGRIILGNMDSRTRLQRLKTLFKHLNLADLTATIATIEKDQELFTHPRNVVSHTQYFGTLKGHPAQLVFGPYKPEIGYDGATFHTLHIDYLKASAAYAREWAQALFTLSGELLESPPRRQEPDRPASRQRSKDKKRPAQPLS